MAEKGEKAKAEKLRKLTARLQKVKDQQDESTQSSTLVDGGGGLSASDWVNRSRKQEAARKMEASSSTKESLNKEKKTYGASDLEGIHVMHDSSKFQEGRDVILTLADSNILEKDDRNKITGLNDAEDVLENVNITDKEKAEAAEKRKKRAKLPAYSGYDDDEFEESFVMGRQRKRKLLAQYSEEEEGAMAPRMTLGGALQPLNEEKREDGGGSVDASKQTQQAKLSSNDKADLSADTSGLLAAVASEYYNESELKSFKKKERKREKRAMRVRGVEKERKTKTKASHHSDEEQTSDLEGALMSTGTAIIPSSSSFAKDYGSRKRLGGISVASSSSSLSEVAETKRRRLTYEKATIAAAKKSREAYKGSMSGGSNGDDNSEDVEMTASIERACRLAKQQQQQEQEQEQKQELGPEWAAKVTASTKPGANGPTPAEKGSRVGFTELKVERQYEDSAGVDLEEQRRADGALVYSGATEFSSLLHARLKEEEEEEEGTMKGARSRHGEGMDVGKREVGEVAVKTEPGLEGSMPRENIVPKKGLAATLAMLQAGGELQQDEALAGRKKDKRISDPSSHDFNIKLDYRDEYGRKLTQKEAFRQLNYAFHGFGPGKKSQEKKLRMMDEERKLKAAQGKIDTSSMKALQGAQSSLGKAHITLGATQQGSAAQEKEAIARVVKKLERDANKK